MNDEPRVPLEGIEVTVTTFDAIEEIVRRTGRTRSQVVQVLLENALSTEDDTEQRS